MLTPNSRTSFVVTNDGQIRHITLKFSTELASALTTEDGYLGLYTKKCL